MAENKTNFIIVLEPCSKAFIEIIEKNFNNNKAVEILNAPSIDEAVQAVEQLMPCMVVASIPDTQHIVPTVTLMKKLENGIKYGRLKTLVMSKVPSPQLRIAITSLGVTDYIEEPIPARTLYFKVNLQLKALDTIKAKDAQKQASQEKMVFSKDKNKKVDAEQKLPEPKSKPALALSDDAFLFKKNSLQKKANKLCFELEGPTPEDGDWVQHEAAPDGSTRWRFVPKEKLTEAKATGDGLVHSGEKPTFSPVTQSWQMSAEKPDVSYHQNGKNIGSKVAVNSKGELEIAEDSPQAKEAIEKLKLKRKAAKAQNNEKTNTIPKEEAEADKQKEVTSTETRPEETATSKKKLNVKRNRLEVSEEEVDTTTEASEEEKKAAFNNKLNASKETLSTFNKLQETTEAKHKTATKTLDIEAEKTQNEEKSGKKKLDKKRSLLKSLDEITNKKDEETETESADDDNNTSQMQQEEKIAAFNNKLGQQENSNKKEKNEQTTSTSPDEEKIKGKPKKLERKRKLLGVVEDENESEAAAIENTSKPTKERTAPAITLESAEEKEKRKKLKRARALQTLKEEMEKPLDTNLSETEVEELEKQFGLEHGKTSNEELAKRKRAAKLKNLKDKLLAENFEPEEESKTQSKENPDFNTQNTSSDDPDNTWSHKSIDNNPNQAKRNARDSDITEDEVDWRAKNEKSADKKQKPSTVTDSGRAVFLHSLEELGDIDGVWEVTDGPYVYLASEIRFHGFKTFSNIMPIWVYGGDQVPEFLEQEKQWRFFDQDIEKIETEHDLPPSVRDYLLSLKKRIAEAKGEKEEAINNKKKLDRLRSLLEENATDDPEENQNLLEQLNQEEQNLSNKIDPEKIAELKTLLEEDIKLQDDPNIEEDFKKEHREKIANLKKQIASDFDEIETESNVVDLNQHQKKKQELAQQDESEEIQEEAEEETEEVSVAEKLEEKLSGSANIAKFLSKRKKQNSLNQEEEKKAERREKIQTIKARIGDKKEEPEAASIVEDLANPRESLALQLAMSDLIFAGKGIKDASKPLSRLIANLAKSVGSCRITVMTWETENSGRVVNSSDGYHETGNVVPLNQDNEQSAADCKFVIAAIIDPKNSKPLGFLYAEIIVPRLSFTEKEKKFIQELAEMFAPQWESPLSQINSAA